MCFIYIITNSHIPSFSASYYIADAEASKAYTLAIETELMIMINFEITIAIESFTTGRLTKDSKACAVAQL